MTTLLIVSTYILVAGAALWLRDRRSRPSPYIDDPYLAPRRYGGPQRVVCGDCWPRLQERTLLATGRRCARCGGRGIVIEADPRYAIRCTCGELLSAGQARAWRPGHSSLTDHPGYFLVVCGCGAASYCQREGSEMVRLAGMV